MICKICNSEKLIKIGRITHTGNQVAGIETNLNEEIFSLVKCQICGFQFKHPDILNSDMLLGRYKDSPEDKQDEIHDPYKRQYDIIRMEAEKYSKGGRVCDIGCSNGSLLQVFSKNWEKYGIEPSQKAVKIAEERDIKIIGETIENIQGYEDFFEVILIIDVIEHLLNPIKAFAKIREMLRPNGVVIVLTGNTDCWQWQLLGANYWYCAVPEHISFFNKNCLNNLGLQTGFQLIVSRKMSHVRSNFFENSYQLAANLFYIVEMRLNKFGISMCRRKFANKGGPGWMTAKDHILCTMKTT